MKILNQCLIKGYNIVETLQFQTPMPHFNFDCVQLKQCWF